MKTVNVSRTQYESLSEFRYQIRKFLHFSEKAARAAGLEPQQHQLLLAVKGFAGEGGSPTIGSLAERLELRPHTTVVLINRVGLH
jgi:DNA-binding MarR family transcriptional regulator